MTAQEGPGAAPYRVHVDADTARDLAQQGAALLMLGVPPGSAIGVDHQAFAAGPKFKGIKMLPPGTHFFSVRAASSGAAAAGMGGMAPPTGFFLHLAARQVVVKVWDAATEQLLDMRDEDEAGRYAEGVRRYDFDAYLAPYDLGSMRRWSSLSSHVSAELIAMLSPLGGSISISAEADDPELLTPRTDAERELVRQLREGKARQAARMAAGLATAVAAGDMQTDTEPSPAAAEEASAGDRQAADAAAVGASGRCFYTRIPRLVKQHGLSAAELTAANLDKSSALLQAAAQRYGGRVLSFLGELQFAFIAFVFGQSLDGFAQWKSLLMLMLGCEEAVLMRGGQQPAFTELLRVVRAQLEATLGAPTGAGAGQEEAPLGLSMVEELLPDSFLRRMFGRFFQVLQENGSEVGSALQREASSLKALLRARLGWEYDIRVISELSDDDDDGDDDDMPVIVDVHEPYAL